MLKYLFMGIICIMALTLVMTLGIMQKEKDISLMRFLKIFTGTFALSVLLISSAAFIEILSLSI